MSKLSTLRNAIVKLDEAEEALFEVRKAFTTDDRYWDIDRAFESIGDTNSFVRSCLEMEEKKELEAENERS